MDVYYFIILLTLFLSYNIKIPEGDYNAYCKKVFWVFFPLLIFGALRVDFGNDYSSYEEDFYTLHNHPELVDPNAHAEIGYQWLNVIMPSWRLLLAFVSTMVVLGFIKLYSKNINPKMLTPAMFFTMLYPDLTFYLSFVSMRTGLAIAGTFLCFPLIKERKYVLVLIIAYLLSFIHTSAILFLPVALLVGFNKALSRKEIFIWIFALIALTVLSTAGLIDLISPLFGNDMFDRYREHYLVADDHSSLISCTANAILMYFILDWVYGNKDNLTKSQNSIWRLSMVYLLSPFLGSLGRTRMTYYFFPFYVIVITYIIQDATLEKWKKIMFVSLVTSIMLYATFYVWLNNPYFIFQHYHCIFW